MRPAILRCIGQRFYYRFRHARFLGSNINRGPAHLASALQKMQPRNARNRSASETFMVRTNVDLDPDWIPEPGDEHEEE
jgi:hypothetical protein